MAAENFVWDAWKNKDARKIEELTTANITFVDIFGNYLKTVRRCQGLKPGPVIRSEKFFANERSGHLSFTNRRHP